MKQAAAYPFLRILLPFLAGIGTCMLAGDGLLSSAMQVYNEILLLLFLICLLLTRNRPMGSWFAALALYAAGTWIWQVTDARNHNFHYLHYPAKGVWKVALMEDAAGKGKYLGATALVLAYADSTGKLHPAQGKTRVLFSKKDGQQPICGNTYYIIGEMMAAAGPSLPDAFNYREYLRRKQIHRQLRADSGAARLIGRIGSIRTLASDLARIIGQRIAAMPDPTRAGLLGSLITGDKQGVTEEDRLHFARTGTLHVLAVSGLHVGIIYGLLLFLTGRFFRRHHPVQAVFVLLCIWAYALISGLAPSVFRAAFMFSLLTLGNVWSHSSKGLNTLAATACCMLCIEPRWLQDVGFLLSFTAVAGILLFYAPMEKAWRPRSKALLYLWKMAAVSIAAQLGTLPVTLYCFNSFPLWFLPANLLVIPLSTLCLICGLLYLLLAGLPLAGMASLWLTDKGLYVLQESVERLAALPMHTIGDIYPNAGAVVAIVWLLFVIAAWKIFPSRYRLAGLMIGLLGLSAAESQRQWQNRFAEPELFALRWQQGTALVSGGMGEAVLLTNKLRPGQVDTLHEGLRKWLRRKGITKVAKAPADNPETPSMMKGRHFRLISGANLYLERYSIYFSNKNTGPEIWVRRPPFLNHAGGRFLDSVNLLKNQLLMNSQSRFIEPLAAAGFQRISLPKNGFIHL